MRSIGQGRRGAAVLLAGAVVTGSSLGLGTLAPTPARAAEPVTVVPSDGDRLISVPAGMCTVTWTLVGGDGGATGDNSTGWSYGGLPGLLQAVMTVTPGQEFVVQAGAAGSDAAEETLGTGGRSGTKGSGGGALPGGAGGGGASMVHEAGPWDDPDFSSVLFIAGGGGGAGSGPGIRYRSGGNGGAAELATAGHATAGAPNDLAGGGEAGTEPQFGRGGSTTSDQGMDGEYGFARVGGRGAPGAGGGGGGAVAAGGGSSYLDEGTRHGAGGGGGTNYARTVGVTVNSTSGGHELSKDPSMDGYVRAEFTACVPQDGGPVSETPKTPKTPKTPETPETPTPAPPTADGIIPTPAPTTPAPTTPAPTTPAPTTPAPTTPAPTTPAPTTPVPSTPPPVAAEPLVPAQVPLTELTLTTDRGVISEVAPGDKLAVIGTGFQPFSRAVVIIYSEPQVLGTVTTDADGSFRLEVEVPAGLEAGEHSLVASGVAPDGSSRFLRMDVTVDPAPVPTAAPAPAIGAGGGLAFTGSAPLVPALAGVGALLAGGLLLLVDRRHRVAQD